VTEHPAKLLGITDKKGALSPGLDADLVVIDDEGNLFQTWKFGEKVFDVDEPVAPFKQEIKKVSTPRQESVPFGERFTIPESKSLKLVKVTSPSGVKVH
jgi:adenine deaminase